MEFIEIALNQCFPEYEFQAQRGAVIKQFWGNAKLNKMKDVFCYKTSLNFQMLMCSENLPE